MILTNSESDLFQDCKRKWWLSVYRHLGRREQRFNIATSVGSLYHEALAAYYSEGKSPALHAREYYGGKIVEITSTYDPIEAELALNDLEKEQDLVVTMLEGYEQWLEEEGADEKLEVLGAEQQVEVDLVPDVKLRGKIDAPVRYRDDPNILLQLEHKTTGDFGKLTKTAKVNTQFLTYDLLARMFNPGRRSDGVLLNMARKVKRTIRAKPPFFMRHPVRHNDEQLRAHWHHLVGIAREIQRTRERLDAGENHHQAVPPRPTPDCTWKCPFAQACLSGMFDDGSDVDGYLAANFEDVDPLERYKISASS